MGRRHWLEAQWVALTHEIVLAFVRTQAIILINSPGAWVTK